MEPTPFDLVRELFQQLRWRRFPLGVTDLAALRNSLAAGFGWSSSEAFRELIVALWAKSAREAEIVRALFARLPWPRTWLAEQMIQPPPPPVDAIVQPVPINTLHPTPQPAPPNTPMVEPPAPPIVQRLGSLPILSLENVDASDARLLFVEQYPLSSREVAQALRRLRRPLRIGPPVELDVGATIARSATAGISVPPILVPARRNTSRLLMLLDVGQAMAPYRPFVSLFRESVLEAGWLQQVQTFYFHDAPFEGTDHSLLFELDENELYPRLDPVLSRIEPASTGELFKDEALTEPVSLADALQSLAAETVALIVSDAGAARNTLDATRLLDTLAFLKALRTKVRAFVWLNPVQKALWTGSNAEQLARFAPVYPLDRSGLEQAVNTLRGQPANVEHPL